MVSIHLFSSKAETPSEVIWPPSQRVGSVRQTDRPEFAAVSAALTPPIPPPMMTTSQVCVSSGPGTGRTKACAGSPSARTFKTSSSSFGGRTHERRLRVLRCVSAKALEMRQRNTKAMAKLRTKAAERNSHPSSLPRPRYQTYVGAHPGPVTVIATPAPTGH